MLIKERRETFKDKYIVATLKEAKRLKYTTEELQQIVREAYEVISNEK